jgi:hypothetical protein
MSFWADPWEDARGDVESVDFIKQKITDVLAGREPDPTPPPAVDILCSSAFQVSVLRAFVVAMLTRLLPQTDNASLSLADPSVRAFVHHARRAAALRASLAAQPLIPARLHPLVFPLYTPGAVDVLVFWALPAQRRRGLRLVPGAALGAGHAPLRALLDAAVAAKPGRSMYAETRTERAGLLATLENAEWNREADPLVVQVHGGELQHDFAAGYVRRP